MRGSAVIEALEDGQKVRRKDWSSTEYIKLNDKSIVDEHGAKVLCSLAYGSLFDNDWEVCDDSITFAEVPMGARFKVIVDKKNIPHPPIYIKIKEFNNQQSQVNCIIVDFPKDSGRNSFGFLDKEEKVQLV